MYNNRATHTGASAKLSRRVSRNSSRSTNRLYVSSAKINVLLKWTTSCGKMHGIDRPAGSKLRGRRAAGCRGAAHERLHNGWGGRRVGGWACQSIRWDDNGTSGLCSDFIFLCKNTVDISLHENMGQCVNIYLIKITWYSLWAVNHLIRDGTHQNTSRICVQSLRLKMCSSATNSRILRISQGGSKRFCTRWLMRRVFTLILKTSK